MINSFKWWEYDIRPYLHKNWDKEIFEYAKKNAKKIKLFPKDSVTSRESKEITSLDTLLVDGNQIRSDLPWLFKLYENTFLEYAEECFKEKVFLAKNDIYALNLNIQQGKDMRYECHIDSNPIQGVFYVTSHNNGGELIVSENSEATGINEIDKNCLKIYPKAGYLYLFPGQLFPHYVRPLKNEDEIRISMPMNFYTESYSEDSRPSDLNQHLFKNN
jgi:hypothetical protein